MRLRSLGSLAVSISVATLGLAATARAAEDFETLTEHLSQATVLVGICDLAHSTGTIPCANFRAAGSGFFINPNGLLVTARHVIPDPLPAGEAVFVLKKDGAGSGWWAVSNRVVSDFQDLDTVAIKFDLKDRKTPWLPLSPVPLRQGEELAVFGFPAAELQLLPNGDFDGGKIISRVAKTVASSVEKRSLYFKPGVTLIDKPMIEAQFTFARGNSGGPIVSVRTGKVVGVVTGAMNIPQDIQFFNLSAQNAVSAVPFATYSYAVAIDAIRERLDPSQYSSAWKLAGR